ncbi:MarR family transcriptional regulator [Kitasatospora sp. GP82]|uniref:MarR family winged helix-turn-helix transcriptional regulator n=1 Tax=Kitasatospora sp. GP82 TaxID=3035089 RepID=UPI002476064C|nr:MarR family transcriptional regulator [Kitasatospora sp. GP82]MDH6125849.1 DNA-binding MarR family transcriptional regulator [Kitasatospora sp. GP82]
MTEPQQAEPGQAAPPPDRDEIADRLRAAALRLAHGLRAPAGRHDLTPSRLTALAVVSAHGPLRVGSLAHHMGISMPSVSRLVDILVAADLVGRRPDPHDQRASLLTLTPSGAAVLDSIRREGLDALTSRLGTLTNDQLATLAAALPVLDSLAHQLVPDPTHELTAPTARDRGRAGHVGR